MPPNKRLQLALQPLQVRPLPSRGLGFIMNGSYILVASVPKTPALQRGAAETLIR